MSMSLKIKNCNNIDSGEITLEENKLNIKYAMNGAGKSTIARAIELQAKGDGSILELTPFKHLEKKDHKPELLGLEKVSGVKVFNDTYINQFVFKPDEVLADSFEIFFKTPTFVKHMEEIDKNISAIKTTFRDSKDIDQVINDLTILSDGFGKSQSGYSAAGPIAKGLGKGNKIANIPKGLESFSDYLQSSTNSKWLRWHMDGSEFSQSHENCPYCASPTAEKKGLISQVSKEFDPKSIEHLNKIMAVVNNLGKYFSKEVNEQLTKITQNVKGLSKEEINYLLRIKGTIETLKTKMLDLRGINFYSMKDAVKVSDFIGALKINLSLLGEMDSPVTRELVDKINKSLDDVLSKVGVLQGEIAKQNRLISKTIEENKDEINNFLKFAGYRYHVDVEYDGSKESYKMRLRHFDSPEALSNGGQHLSYGEKNAFALVLFMYECLSRNPGIIILDDPISSFDRNKKYAVIDMLFRGKKSLRDRTVLLMTHDLEPVIDVIFNFPHLFASNSNAAFFWNLIGGS
jgi:wobble nucleotide-excising tRNase